MRRTPYTRYSWPGVNGTKNDYYITMIVWNTRDGRWASECVAGAKTDGRNCENWPANAKTATGIITILYGRQSAATAAAAAASEIAAAGASNSPPHRRRPLPRSRSPPVTRTYRWLLPFPFSNAERVTSIMGYCVCRKHTYTRIYIYIYICMYNARIIHLYTSMYVYIHTVSRFSRTRWDEERRLQSRCIRAQANEWKKNEATTHDDNDNNNDDVNII